MDTSVVGMVLLGVVVVWLALLTAGVLRWRRERGAPVYRRLPDGRLRFEWAVSNAYQSARRASLNRVDPVPDCAPTRSNRDCPGPPGVGGAGG